MRFGPGGRSEAFAAFCILLFGALLLVALASVDVVNYGECRARAFSRLYCLFRR